MLINTKIGTNQLLEFRPKARPTIDQLQTHTESDPDQMKPTPHLAFAGLPTTNHKYS
jgi:hypothetical protein